uniref:Phosphatidylinositol 4,5-bisphosphate 3-kinase catalytic subunit gamma isoform-like n=1 Tax=Cyprinodon variegatus TaxID=28743 RepID=A0A3Q2D3W1_CYPVA
MGLLDVFSNQRGPCLSLPRAPHFLNPPLLCVIFHADEFHCVLLLTASNCLPASIQAQQQSCHPDPFAILDPEKYLLLYARGGDWYEALDDCQILRTLDIPWSLDDSRCLVAHIVAKPRVAGDLEQKKRQQQTLKYLIGHDLEQEASDRLGELTFTRRKLASPRRVELKNRHDVLYATEPWVTQAPVPSELEEWLNRKLPVTLHYMSKISFSILVDLKATPDVLLQVFGRVMEEQGVEYDFSEELVLKVSGREEFLSGENSLIDFLWVRQCLKASQDLHLSVVPVSNLPPDSVRFVDWPLVDGFSGQFSAHEDLSLHGKDLDDIFMISLLDCNRKLRVKLLGFDIPQLPSKPPQSVFVEASILYGGKVLCSVCSPSKPFADEVLWNEWLDFDILLRDLPRGVKLSFTINACAGDTSPTTKDPKPASLKDPKVPTSRDSKPTDLQRGRGKVLYFVNLLLIDHRSVFAGPYTLHMWSYPDLEDGAITYQADKLSSATNPHIDESMAISFLLDRYSFPVVLPNTFRHSNSSASPTSGLFPDKSTASTSSLSPQGKFPLEKDSVTRRSPSPVFNTKGDHLRRFREESVQYASNLPHFLRDINWLDRKMVEDVHWLLGLWDPGELDVHVALELLSTDFPDEIVRKLAVRRLEALPNDDVLKYLLQLVQTLKVEPYHDSFLARYLIQRALRVSHTSVAETLPSFQLQINKLFPLMQLDRCKVMASKKKPLWLEFSPMPSPTSNTPVGIIFKEGDDLRQDMLVIQTLVVMESIWQEKSLDLNLIPYGCISTGHNIGMIEIVRNAATIAAVQRSLGGTTATFRNDALFEWLRSKCPLQEIAVERFVKSCAGYCVATYVLGIGDRHNDNIMITDQGNLFHIDFGHILGNRKRFLGVSRERAPFVLTPDFLYVMGRVKSRNSLYFQRFRETCSEAYLLLRSHSRLLITLFSLMLLTGIPELSAAEDMRYLREALQEDQSEGQAKAHFLEKITECENLGWTVQANWWIHMVAGIKRVLCKL